VRATNLRRLLADATPGPWGNFHDERGVPWVLPPSMTHHDRALIVAGVNALPALLDLVERLYHDDPCRYDHGDNCQSHSLHDKPCPHGIAQQMFNESPRSKET